MFISDPQEEVPSLLSASLSLSSRSSLPCPPHHPLSSRPNPWRWDEATHTVSALCGPWTSPTGAVLGDSRDSGLCGVGVDLAAGGSGRAQGKEGLLREPHLKMKRHTIQGGWATRDELNPRDPAHVCDRLRQGCCPPVRDCPLCVQCPHKNWWSGSK